MASNLDDFLDGGRIIETRIYFDSDCDDDSGKEEEESSTKSGLDSVTSFGNNEDPEQEIDSRATFMGCHQRQYLQSKAHLDYVVNCKIDLLDSIPKIHHANSEHKTGTMKFVNTESMPQRPLPRPIENNRMTFNFQCRKCDLRFPSKSLLKQHKIRWLFRCVKCHIDIDNCLKFRDHIYSCTSEKHVICPCGKRFINEKNYDLHITVCREYIASEYNCIVCHSNYGNTEDLLEHQISEHKVSSECKMQVDTTSYKNLVKKYVSPRAFKDRGSPALNSLKCPLCKNTFRTKQLKNLHIQELRKNSNHCIKCNYTSSNFREVEMNSKSKHPSEPEKPAQRHVEAAMLHGSSVKKSIDSFDKRKQCSSRPTNISGRKSIDIECVLKKFKLSKNIIPHDSPVYDTNDFESDSDDCEILDSDSITEQVAKDCFAEGKLLSKLTAKRDKLKSNEMNKIKVIENAGEGNLHPSNVNIDTKQTHITKTKETRPTDMKFCFLKKDNIPKLAEITKNKKNLYERNKDIESVLTEYTLMKISVPNSSADSDDRQQKPRTIGSAVIYHKKVEDIESIKKQNTLKRKIISSCSTDSDREPCFKECEGIKFLAKTNSKTKKATKRQNLVDSNNIIKIDAIDDSGEDDSVNSVNVNVDLKLIKRLSEVDSIDIEENFVSKQPVSEQPDQAQVVSELPDQTRVVREQPNQTQICRVTVQGSYKPTRGDGRKKYQPFQCNKKQFVKRRLIICLDDMLL